jgi:two-component system, OmpR family, alkaline phosphatase synthesis response regulator PhoP
MLQGYEQSPLLDPVVSENADYCEITNRILIVSPRPASLRSLVAELAVKCYDVLLLHHADDPLLKMVQGSIVVIDRTAEPHFSSAISAGQGSVPVLALVRDASSVPFPNEEWVIWPCSTRELIAKINELSLKYPIPSGEPHIQSFKDIVVDASRMTVSRGGSRIDLTKTEFDLLRALMTAGGKVLSRDDLIHQVWGEQNFGGSNAVDVHIRSLRQKLGDDPREPRYIATVRGAGYRLADI